METVVDVFAASVIYFAFVARGRLDVNRVVDFAYSDCLLLPHTDCNYLVDVPGYQVLNSAQRIDVEGGVRANTPLCFKVAISPLTRRMLDFCMILCL